MEQVWRSVTKASISTTTGVRSVTNNKTEAFERKKTWKKIYRAENWLSRRRRNMILAPVPHAHTHKCTGFVVIYRIINSICSPSPPISRSADNLAHIRARRPHTAPRWKLSKYWPFRYGTAQTSFRWTRRGMLTQDPAANFLKIRQMLRFGNLIPRTTSL